MTHEQIVARADELGLDTDGQSDEQLLAAIGQAEEEDRQASADAQEARDAAAQAELEAEAAEVERLRMQAIEDEKAEVERARVAAATAEATAKAIAEGKPAPPPPTSPTKLYQVSSAFWFTDARTGQERKANNGMKVRLTDAQGAKYTRYQNATLIA
jgi:FKBP-type peptidyl-prolyl cis-trans isomerase